MKAFNYKFTSSFCHLKNDLRIHTLFVPNRFIIFFYRIAATPELNNQAHLVSVNHALKPVVPTATQITIDFPNRCLDGSSYEAMGF